MSALQVITEARAMSRVVARWKEDGHTVAFIPTMGFLHDGHRALIIEAASRAARVVVSIFVNPLQFAKTEDFEGYPQNSSADLEFLEANGVDAVFMPTLEEVYPPGPDAPRSVPAGPIGDVFEGATRPGHFGGVLTVVTRLFDVVDPDIAVFGKKDAQQLFLVTDMVATAGLALRIVAVDTVRDSDGVALSSRNSYLSPEERKIAAAIPRALENAASAPSLADAKQRVVAALEAQAGLHIDYVDAVDPRTFAAIGDENFIGEALVILAVVVGTTRLIDNRSLHFPQ